MGDKKSNEQSTARELTGSFLDHQSGRSFPYVVRYRATDPAAANDVPWEARIKLAARWHAVDADLSAYPVNPSAHRLQTEEDVRDAALSAMCAMDVEAALQTDASARQNRLSVRLLGLSLIVAAVGSGAWWWETHSFPG